MWLTHEAKWGHRPAVRHLHTGAFLGQGAAVLGDGAAASLILLTLTGVYLWLWPRWNRRSDGRPDGVEE